MVGDKFLFQLSIDYEKNEQKKFNIGGFIQSLEIQKTMVWQPCWMTEPFVWSSNMHGRHAMVFLDL